ncbi:unnamed protein product [Camellia sinensis]
MLFCFLFGCLLASAPNVHTIASFRILLCLGYSSINGSHHEVWPDSGEKFYEGDFRPNDIMWILSIVNVCHLLLRIEDILHWMLNVAVV